MIWAFTLLFPLFAIGVPFTSDRSPSYPFVSGDGFRAYADYVFDETDQNLNPLEVKPRSTIFVKTDYLPDFFSKIHPYLPDSYILITHNSDHSAPGPFRAFLEEEKMIAWFGQNIDWQHPKLYPIPIGIANRFWPHGNVDILMKAIEKESEKKHWLYHNFVIQNYYQERWHVFQLFSNAPFCFRPYRKSFESYLADMKASRFVLSPRGNGLDTHRLWEAIYVGSFPIVKTSTLDVLYADLPVIIVSDWEEVTETFLIEKYKELREMPISLEKSTMGYWMERIDRFKIKEEVKIDRRYSLASPKRLKVHSVDN